jgi:hypothetical protein
MFSHVQDNYRIIFNHEELIQMNKIVNKINKNYIERNPFIQQLPGSHNLQKSMIFYTNMDRKVNDMATFMRRAYYATGGALEGINLKDYKAAWTGSLLIPCLMNCELERVFSTLNHNLLPKKYITKRMNFNARYGKISNAHRPNKEDDSFMEYLEFYYASALSLKDDEYNKFIAQPENQAFNVEYDDIEPSQPQNQVKEMQIDDIPLKIDEDEENPDSDVPKSEKGKKIINKPGYNQMADIDIAISTPNWDDFDEQAIQIMRKINKNCMSHGIVYFEKVITLSGYKYVCRGPGLIRPIEIFRVRQSHLKLVKGFHVPCVHSYFDGNIQLNADLNPNSLVCLIEAVCAILSGVNGYYKWFACNKVPIDVILKYAQRGITTIINKRELLTLTHYIHINERWKPIIPHIKGSIWGYFPHDHVFFRSGDMNFGIRYGLDPIFTNIQSNVSRKIKLPTPPQFIQNVCLNVKNNNQILPPIDKNQLMNLIEQHV